jgi:hypothetical protein
LARLAMPSPKLSKYRSVSDNLTFYLSQTRLS